MLTKWRMRQAMGRQVFMISSVTSTCEKPLCLSLCCKMDRWLIAIVITWQGQVSPSILSSFLGFWTRTDGWRRFRKGQSIPSQERKNPKPVRSVLPGRKQCWHHRSLEKLLVARRKVRSLCYFHETSCLAVQAMLMSQPFFISLDSRIKMQCAWPLRQKDTAVARKGFVGIFVGNIIWIGPTTTRSKRSGVPLKRRLLKRKIFGQDDLKFFQCLESLNPELITR